MATSENVPRAVVTGASRGLGLEFAHQLLRSGWEVVAGCRNSSNLNRLIELQRTLGLLRIVKLDVLEPLTVEQELSSLPGSRVDLLINNAGIYVGGDCSLEHAGLDEVDLAWRTNAIGPMLVTRALLPRLRRGAIIANISSRAGSNTLGTNRAPRYAYAMSKAALNRFTTDLAVEMRSRGVVVVALNPGWVATDMGTSNAPLSASNSVRGMLDVIDSLDETTTGKFFDYSGQEIPW